MQKAWGRLSLESGKDGRWELDVNRIHLSWRRLFAQAKTTGQSTEKAPRRGRAWGRVRRSYSTDVSEKKVKRAGGDAREGVRGSSSVETWSILTVGSATAFVDEPELSLRLLDEPEIRLC